MVFNPLNIAREDVVEANVNFPGGMPKSCARHRARRQRSSGADCERQSDLRGQGAIRRLCGLRCAARCRRGRHRDNLQVSENSLENQYYRVKLNADGDVASIFDKSLGKELLAAPARLAISYDNPEHWPAWNMDWDQEQAAPKAYVSGPAKIRVVENGPARVAVEVSRETAGSRFVQTIRLVGRRCRKARGVRQRDRLEYQRVESEGDFPADRLQRDGHLQLGHRHDRAAHRASRKSSKCRRTSGSI